MVKEDIKDITPENVFEIDVPKLALNSNFGKLVFENANKKLSKTQRWLKEAQDLGYKDLLLDNDISYINTYIRQLAEHLEWLRKFDIGTVANVKAEHDNFDNRIDNFYNTVYQAVVMKYLPFLREERRREKPDEKKLEEEVRKISQLRSELENELKSVRAETEKIRTTGKEVGSSKGERAAVRLAAHFDSEVERYAMMARRWLWGVVIGYIVVMGFLGLVAYLYILGKTTFSIEAGIAKLVLAAALWYGLSFIIKNYNVNSHLAAINRHRAAIARTLEDFIAVEKSQTNPRLSEMLQNAAEAMFKNAPIGFISKAEKESGNPVLQVVNDLMGIRGNQ